jgi:hypothetical protein
MGLSLLHPPLTPPAGLEAALRRQGYAVLDAAGVRQLSGCDAIELQALRPYWDDLPPDAYLRDGGRYRRRRHSCFVLEGGQLRQVPHRAHWQPLQYNALHGGIHRLFEPLQPALVAQPAWGRLLHWLGRVADALHGPQRWHIEAHAFRIEAHAGIGRPTPEGAHRDGVDWVAVCLLGRQGIKGGETRVFEADGPYGQRFTLTEPWSVLLLDDARVIHETTPIQPLRDDGQPAWRDTLVLTLRAGAFLGEDPGGGAAVSAGG